MKHAPLLPPVGPQFAAASQPDPDFLIVVAAMRAESPLDCDAVIAFAEMGCAVSSA
jgi:hypothetical protein